MERPPAKLIKRGGTETARQDGDGEKAQNWFSIQWKAVFGGRETRFH